MPDGSSDDPGRESVVANLAAFDWDQDESVAYEVAVETIGVAMAAYTAAIHREQAKAEPDADQIQQWRSGRAACVAERDRLRATDHAGVARVRQEYARLAETVRDQGR